MSVDFRQSERLALNRDQPFATLAGGFREELLEPRAEIGDAGRDDDRDLVASRLCENADDRAEHDAGIVGCRHACSAGAHHRFRRREKPAEIKAHRRGRHHAEVRQHRVSPADARLSERDMTEAVAFGDLLQIRPGIGDGDEMGARALGAEGCRRALEKILLQNVRLERTAGFARDDEKRARRIDPVFDTSDLRGIRRVEHQ